MFNKKNSNSGCNEAGVGSGTNVATDALQKKPVESVMALCMVELGDGLSAEQVRRLIGLLPADRKYIPIEFHDNNSSVYGFVDSEYYERHNYDPIPFEKNINAILNDKNLETPDGLYLTPDGRKFYMSYFTD